MKKLLSIILSICMLLSITAGLNLTAYADTVNGTCGVGVSWSYDTETCELIISGTGDMENYANSSNVPWYSYHKLVKTVTIESGITSICKYAFSYCYNLTNIDVASSNMYYSSLDGVLFNKDKTTLIKYPAEKSETSYTIPNTVTIIVDYAFYGSNLTSVTIPNSVTSIGDFAFPYCFSLTNVAIPDGVTSIGFQAFFDCTSLKSIVIGNGVTSISDHAFSNCTALTSIDVASSNMYYSSQDGVLFNKDKTTLIVYPISKPETSYTIPNSVTSIGGYAFEYCKNLTSITIPNTVTSIDRYTFAYCSNLGSITIPNSVTTIGSSAFDDCTSLTDVYYTGTEAQWNSISIDTYYNNCLINATKHYNYVPLCAVHTWDSGTVITPATCTSTGIMTYKCTVCTDGAKTEIIPMTGHTTEVIPAVAPTCSSTGLTEGSKCSVCGETIVEQETVAKTAHTPIIFPAVAPTCSSTGLTAGSKCAVCGETIVEQETVAKTAHTYKDVVTKATTSKNGKTESKCSVCGNVSKTTTIYAAKSVTLSKTAYTYTGKAIKPAVTVKDSKGNVIDSKYYTVKYTNNKNVGKATVTITLKGNYSGTLKATFKINPKATTLSSVTANSKGFTAKWKKQSTQTTGYQIQYSTSKKFTSKTTKTVTVKDAKTLTKTISKLKANTKYYVRVRTYKTVSKVNYYSSWSAAKTVTTKK